MILPQHPAQRTAYMGLASIAVIIFLTIAVTHSRATGAAGSEFGIPPSINATKNASAPSDLITKAFQWVQAVGDRIIAYARPRGLHTWNRTCGHKSFKFAAGEH